MEIFLQFSGPVFLVLIAIGLTLIFWMFFKWRRFKKNLTTLEKGPVPPSHIHLEQDSAPKWVDKENAAAMAGRLKQSGFLPGKAYVVKEMSQVALMSFFHSKTGLCSVLYDHDQAENWIDLMALYKDGRRLTVSSAPVGGETDHSPDTTKIFIPNANIKELAAAYNQNRLKGLLARIDSNNFQKVFEKAYADEMKWRAENGGMSQKEIERVAQNMSMDEKFTPEKNQKVHSVDKELGLDNWHRECMDAFRLTTTMSVAEWTHLERTGMFIIIPRKANARHFVDYLVRYLDLSDHMEKHFKKLAEKSASTPALFKQINQILPLGRRARKAGVVDKPISAFICHVPFGNDE